ncbi:hypothetical protein SEA_THIQQUMS_47 [Streptomyces phage Thiqqums]|nr:hypothetical protein SEA_RAINYDAI_45 [Streptomyces phage Rainydai]QNL30662.1 hypothetical protein SEA_THIQQUMS_47 [Streptomyces phage Thiqqums]
MGIGTRVNNYWCGDGTITGVEGNYAQVEWDSGLVNEAILGYRVDLLRVIDK